MSKSLGNTVVPQDVDEAVRRRHSAPVGGDHGLLGRPAARQERCCRPTSTPIASCATRSAGCWARWPMTTATKVPLAEMPELERLMLHRLAELDEVGARRLRRLRLQAHHQMRCSTSWSSTCRPSISTSARTRSTATRRRACGAQGGGAGGAPSVRPSGDMAGADAALHHGRSLAGPSSRQALGASGAVSARCPADWRDEALAEKWRKVRKVRRVVTGALEIERAKKVIGSSLEAAPVGARFRRRALARRSRMSTMAESRHHQRHRRDRRRKRRRTPSRLDDVAGVAVVPASGDRRRNARAPGATRTMSAPTRISRMYRRAMLLRCRNFAALGRLA